MGCKVVGGRWVDVDKGDLHRPDYRSRFVAKEINTGYEEGLYASTPPLEALRWMLSEAATIDEADRYEEKVILISDVSRAFFEAPATRKIAVALPEEALNDEEKGKTWLEFYRCPSTGPETQPQTSSERSGDL